MQKPPPPPIVLLAPDQDGSADTLVDLLIAIARRVVADRAVDSENVLELPSRDHKQAA